MKPKVSIVVLNWNNYADTKECLESLEKITYSNCEIIIVDNGSIDGSTSKIQQEFPKHTYIYNKTNLGFTGGNNAGMKYAVKNGSDYVFWINNDMIVDPDFLEPLVQAGEKGAGIIGPVTYCYPEKDKIYTAGEDLRFLGLGIKRYRELGKAREVDFVGGAFLVKREVMEKIGYFYEPYFLNHEETDFCFRAKRAGFRVFYEPKSKIWHKVGKTLKKTPVQSTYYYYRNKLLFLKRNYRLMKYPLYLYWNLYLLARFLEKSIRGDKSLAFAIEQAQIDFWKCRFGKRDLNGYSRILIFQPGGIGDMVMFIPSLKILRANFPEAKINIWVAITLSAGDLLEGSGLADKIFRFSLAEHGYWEKLKFIYKLRKKKYDLSVIPTGVNPRKAWILSLLLGARTRLREKALDKTKHTVESNAEILKQIKVKVSPLPWPHLDFAEEKNAVEEFLQKNNLKDKKIIGFHPGAGKAHWYLLWGKDKFVELEKKILENYSDARILIFGGPGEEALCQEIKDKIRGEKVFLALGMPLRRVAGLMESCKIFVASDSGLGHVASTTQTNIVSIFGPSSAKRSAPFGSKVWAVQGECRHPDEGPHDPANDRIHACLQKISVESIFNKVKNILDEQVD